MNDKISQSKNNSINRLNVDKKMVSILTVFVILGIFLLISIIVSTNSISALRGFATLQTNWTTARKEVTFQLVNYLRTQDEEFKTQADSSIRLIRKMESIRTELMKEDTDRQLVRSLFIETNTIPYDIGKMINTFENFHEFPDFKESIRIWNESDKFLYDIEALLIDAATLIAENKFTPQLQSDYIARTVYLDKELTLLQFELSRSLASGTKFLNLVIILVTLSLGMILLITGATLSIRFMKSIKSWSAEIQNGEDLLKDQLIEKTHLLSEVHDRVKNNLALVSTLVQLQQNMVEKGLSEDNYVNTVSRIKSMALVHERLYQNETFSSIRMDEYINDLIDNLHPKKQRENTNLVLEVSTTPVVLSIDKAIPTGLLLNEVLANAFKYGIGNKNPKIKVDLLSEGEEVIISISDNGSGLPETTKLEKPATLGFRLISVLVKQLRANFSLDTDGGTAFTFRYQISDKVGIN
ncbi:MAG: hypothetical protein JXR20_11065 [Balneola sp.]